MKTLLLLLLLAVNLDVYAQTGALFEKIPGLKGPANSKEDCQIKSLHAYSFMRDIQAGKSMYEMQESYPGISVENTQKFSMMYKLMNNPMFELMIMMGEEDVSTEKLAEMQAMKVIMEPSTIRDAVYTSCLKELNMKVSINAIYSVTSESLNVRNKPSMQGDIVARLKHGDKVTVLAQSNNWVEISSELVTASPSWVYSRYLSKVDE